MVDRLLRLFGIKKFWIQEGKYLTRNNKKAIITYIIESDSKPLKGIILDGDMVKPVEWDSEGKYLGMFNSGYDLVDRYE